MSLFRRRSTRRSGPAPAAADAPRDTAFPALTAGDADWIRATAQRVLAENGVEATLEADGATFTASDGYRITLDNAFATCASASRDEWLTILERHFGRMARTTTLPGIDDLTIDQIRNQVRTRLVPDDALTAMGIDMAAYARPVADDLAAVLCIDFPETITYVSSHYAERFPDLDELFRFGQMHTDAEPIDSVQDVGNGVIAVAGDSVFTASKILNLDGLLTHLRMDAPRGVIVSVPERSTIFLHPIRDLSVIETIGVMASAGASYFEDAAYSVSPNLYHWYRGRLSYIGGLDHETDSIAIRPTDELTEILNGLVG
ncbi:hypothetical protein [Gordonia phthalatica]|uniref:Uncharacterized protein n=1 Tax=Gordonia phthalatica TaxID=1136941 RepID=A0A0N9NC87_9ACTN|nr:hypothetical protein [Gordonia phthalatica]ALG85267.1 hypothetical protein ACH46_13250 [Gordonia phthalatica]